MMISIYEYWDLTRTRTCNQYFPCVYRLPVLSLSGHCVYVQAQYVICGPIPGEDCHRRVLPGGHSLPVLLLALSHSLLPLGGGVPCLLQVSTCNTHCIYFYFIERAAWPFVTWMYKASSYFSCIKQLMLLDIANCYSLYYFNVLL